MKTLQDFAAELSQAFTGGERSDGSKYRYLKDGSPEWMKDVCHEAHGDMFPDDWRYEFIEVAADALAESDDPDDIQLGADVYTHDLTSWLGSRVDRYSYCDEARDELGREYESIIHQIMDGQLREKEETLGLVRHALEAMVEGQEEEETESDAE